MRAAERPLDLDAAKSLVGFEVGGVHYAIDIERVRAIVNPLETTGLPHTPAEIAGVADYREEVVTVVDLRVRFGVGVTHDPRKNKVILLRGPDQPKGPGRTVGLLVDGVTDVFGRVGSLRPAPDVGGDAPVRGILGVTVHAGRMTFVLDSGRLAAVAEEHASALGAGRSER